MLDAGLEFAVKNDSIDEEGVVSLYKGQGKTISIEEAKKIINEIKKKHCKK